jgi:hypothetical protein
MVITGDRFDRWTGKEVVGLSAWIDHRDAFQVNKTGRYHRNLAATTPHASKA